MTMMKIAIIGGGISGLATYLQLTKHFSDSSKELCITIFESHAPELRKQNSHSEAADGKDASQPSGVPSVGAAYGLAANGMASLRRINPGIHGKVLNNSFPTPRFQMKTRQGWTLGAINAVMTFSRSGETETCCMVLREVVLEALYEHVPSNAMKIRKVVEVVDGETEAVVRYEDGEQERFDLVIGADGIWSRARKAVSGDENGPEYRRLATLGGFIQTTHLLPTAPTTGALPCPQSHTTMIFGNNGFFAYSPCNTSSSVPTITSSHTKGTTALEPGDLSFWWARSTHEDAQMEPDVEVAKRDLKKRTASWKDPNIPRILEHGVKTSVIPTYVLPRQKTWAGRRVVLVGDAAHALPTSSGQGVSQSLEDAEALAMLLAHHFSSAPSMASKMSEKLQKVFQQYMTVRKAHVERVLDAGNRGGDSSRDMNVVAEYTLYAFLCVMFRFFSRLLTKEIENYDVVGEVEKVSR